MDEIILTIIIGIIVVAAIFFLAVNTLRSEKERELARCIGLGIGMMACGAIIAVTIGHYAFEAALQTEANIHRATFRF